jgi:hypothetical protein
MSLVTFVPTDRQQNWLRFKFGGMIVFQGIHGMQDLEVG